MKCLSVNSSSATYKLNDFLNYKMGNNSGINLMGLLWEIKLVCTYTHSEQCQLPGINIRASHTLMCTGSTWVLVKMQILTGAGVGEDPAFLRSSQIQSNLFVHNSHFELQSPTLLVVLLYHMLIYNSVLSLCLYFSPFTWQTIISK